MAHVRNSPGYIIVTEAIFLKTVAETICAMRQELLVDRDIQMTRHKSVKTKEDYKLKFACRSTFQLSDDYAELHKQTLKHAQRVLVYVGQSLGTCEYSEPSPRP